MAVRPGCSPPSRRCTSTGSRWPGSGSSRGPVPAGWICRPTRSSVSGTGSLRPKEAATSLKAGLTPTDHPLLAAALRRGDGTGAVLSGKLSLQAQPWLADHAAADSPAARRGFRQPGVACGGPGRLRPPGRADPGNAAAHSSRRSDGTPGQQPLGSDQHRYDLGVLPPNRKPRRPALDQARDRRSGAEPPYRPGPDGVATTRRGRSRPHGPLRTARRCGLRLRPDVPRSSRRLAEG